MSRLIALALLLGAALPSAAAARAPWTKVTGALAQRGAAVETRPDRFAAFALDREGFAAAVAGVPLEGTRAAPKVVSIPAPDGTLQRFEAVESPVMEPGLAARHPEITTFAAVGVDDPTARARFDLTALGFHASVRSERGWWYVDPYFRDEDRTHVAYHRRDLSGARGPLVEPEEIAVPERAGRGRGATARAAGDAVVQRVYRLAFLTNPGYADAFGGGANVASANATLVNRVNQLYNDDLAIKLVLVADNDKLNLDTEIKYSAPVIGACLAGCFAPPLTGQSCDTQTLVANQLAIDEIIGDENYDIGHIGLGGAPLPVLGGGGGVALLGVVGQSGTKASGCTGQETPKGDFYAVDYVAHEMGHQFGGNHTFNGANGACSGNENDDTGVEVGSGSSVQAYAGICDADNLQEHSDPYFSQRSIEEIQAYVTSDIADATEEGSTVVTTANRSPVVTAPPARTIPVRTPFTLTGTATDGDSAGLVYSWEQNDAGAPKALLSNTKADGPLFRIFSFASATTDEQALLTPSPGQNAATAAGASRSFPDLAQVAAGNTNAADGTCPAPAAPPTAAEVDCYSEFLPTSARTLNFRLTVRDLFAGGGGVSSADTVITVAGDAPFRVTSQGAAATVAPGATLPVTWDVAGTAAAPFSVANVKISYSADGGLTFPTVLAASTANDGAEPVTVPNLATTKGRVKVEAVGNVFFDVSRGDLTVVAVPSAGPSPTADPTAGFLRPDLGLTTKRIRVSKQRRVRVRVRCLPSGTTNVPTTCKGSVRLFARLLGKRQKRIGRKAYSVAAGTPKVVTIRIRRRAYRKLLRTGRLKVTIRASANGRKTRKRVALLP